MGKEVKNASSVLLAKDEVVVKVCEYGSVSAKDYFRAGSICLTNKRLIHHIHEEGKESKADYQDEFPVSDIDSISYALEKKRKPINLVVILLAAILFIGSIVMIIVGKNTTTTYVSIGAIVVSIIIAILAFFLRKEMSSFDFSISTYNNIYHQLGFGNVPDAVLDDVETKKKSKAGKIISIAITVALFLGGALMIFLSTQSDNWMNGLPTKTIIGIVLIGLSFISSALAYRVVRKPSTKKVALVDGVMLQGAVVTVNTEVCKSFLNDIGSTINDIKEKK